MYAGVADLADAGAARFVALFAIAHNAMFGGTDPRLRSKASRLALFPRARRLNDKHRMLRCGQASAPQPGALRTIFRRTARLTR